MFKGTIIGASLYDRALLPDEIAAIAAGRPIVTRRQVLDGLSVENREKLTLLEVQVEILRTEREQLGEQLPETDMWTHVAHALFNLKEFIYVR